MFLVDLQERIRPSLVSVVRISSGILFSVIVFFFLMRLIYAPYLADQYWFILEQLGWGKITFNTTFFYKCTPLGDSLVLLALGTSIICYLYLKERFLATRVTGLGYFWVFILFTINLVTTLNLLYIFLFFEFLFIPSLFFVYILGYTKRVPETIRYLLYWTLSGSFLVLISFIYLYTCYGSLDLTDLSQVRLTF